MPKKSQRRPEQRYVHWVVESAQYLYMDIHQLDNYFNWTMTYKKNSDFYIPYGRVRQKKQHPPLGSPELAKIIEDFGKNNMHLAHNRTSAKAAWFVSHCATQARREKLVKELQKHMTVQVRIFYYFPLNKMENTPQIGSYAFLVTYLSRLAYFERCTFLHFYYGRI